MRFLPHTSQHSTALHSTHSTAQHCKTDRGHQSAKNHNCTEREHSKGAKLSNKVITLEYSKATNFFLLCHLLLLPSGAVRLGKPAK